MKKVICQHIYVTTQPGRRLSYTHLEILAIDNKIF